MTAERWQQIKAVLAAALERAPAERSAFLDQACGADTSLRAEVESLLAFDQTGEGGNSSSQVYPAIEPNQSGAPPIDRTAGEVGDRIGPYRIVRELACGGMGAVYLAARADDQYRRQVAIKLIRHGMDTDFVLRRFRNERQILAGLDHPNIAKLLDGGTTEAGLPYLVMEYVEGLPIDEYCDQHAFDTEQRLRLFQQVCGAVHYAHQRQVIHRDIKPSNIMVAQESGLKLLDFGIAKLLTPELAAQTLDPTLTSLRLMTPAYASPEQIKGDPITTATDVYSLGVLLYELLTGHKPYRVKSQAPHEITQAVLEEEPVKPSTAITLTEETTSPDGSSSVTLTPESVSKTREGSPDRLRRRLRGDLDNIVLTALRKDPTRRYASVGQFSEDIRRHLEGLPVMARGDSLGYRAAKFIRRNRVAVASFVLALLLLGPLALLAYLRSSRQAITVGPPRTIAVLPFKTVGTQSSDDYLATGIPDAIVSALTNVKGVTVRPIRSSLKYTGAGQDPVEAGRALRVDVVIDGTTSSDEERLRITARLTRVEDSPGDWKTKTLDDLDDLLDIQDVIPAQLAEAIGLELTDQERMLVAKRHTNNVQAYRLYLKGRHLFNRRNAKDAKQAIECFEQAIELDPSFALAYSALAHIHILAITPAPTLEKMQRARIAAMKSLEIDDTLAEAHMALGRALIYCDWDWAGSERAFKRAIELSPNYADAHFWYSHNLTVQARHDEALAELKRALEIDPFSPGYVMRLGTALHLAGQHDRAIDEYRKTPFQVDSAYYQVHWRLGTVYAEKGMYADAISSLKKAEVLSGERPLAKASLAYVHVKSGNSAEARKVLAELGSLPEGEGPRFTLAAVYGCLGEKDRAFRLLEELYHERESGIIGIRVSRMFECIRSDPRFEDLCRRIGLTQ